MAEYIVEYPDDVVSASRIEECINVHERIVRCRDCKHYDFGFCRKLIWRNNGFPVSICGDKFCAWGERR